MQSVEAILKELDHCSHWPEKKRFIHRLKKIPDQEILNQISMAEMSKILFTLRKKYHKEIEIIPIENDLMLRVGAVNVGNMSYLAVYLHFMTIRNATLHVEGNISIPAPLYPKSDFYAKVNGRKAKVTLYDGGLDLSLGGEIYEKRTAFNIAVPLTEQYSAIEFFHSVEGIECGFSRINSMRFAPVADEIKGQYCFLCGWIIQIAGNQILCHKADEREHAEYEKEYQKALKCLPNKNTEWVINLRNEYFQWVRYKAKPIWLIMDRSDRADDNGEVFFKYMQQHKEVDTYFVIGEQCKDYKRLQEIGKVIPLYSGKHYLLSLLAECVISSQCNGFVENPFWDNGKYFRDLYHQPNLIFLQHGVIKDDMSPTLNRFHTNLKGFVTSTEPEFRSLLEYPYHYDKESVWLTGLPVFDSLQNNDSKCIVIAPTWRKGLMDQQWDEEKHEMVWTPKEDIEYSEYYKRYRELIRDPKLIEACRENAYTLVFKPHPLMEPYLSGIVAGTDVRYMGKGVSYQDVLSKGSLMVTDYSSLAFEFAYLGKSTLYYQFDRKDFFSSHTYRQGYFNYVRDGFGEVCGSKRKLIGRIIAYMEKGCVVKDKYRDRMRQLYPRHGGACGRIYEHIRQITAGEEGELWER